MSESKKKGGRGRPMKNCQNDDYPLEDNDKFKYICSDPHIVDLFIEIVKASNYKHTVKTGPKSKKNQPTENGSMQAKIAEAKD